MKATRLNLVQKKFTKINGSYQKNKGIDFNLMAKPLDTQIARVNVKLTKGK